MRRENSGAMLHVSVSSRQCAFSVGDKVWVGPDDSDDVYYLKDVTAVDEEKNTVTVNDGGRDEVEPFVRCFE